MQLFPEDWTILMRINYIQRKILLNSILYYEHNRNMLSDHFYDNMCKQLVSYQKIFARHSSVKDETTYGYAYYDFDGSTGYHLYGRLIEQDTNYLLMITETYLGSRNRKGCETCL